MNSLDLAALDFINSFAGRSWLLDRGMIWLSQSDLLQGSLATICFWHVWFRPREDSERRHEQLLTALGGAFLALAICRITAISLPFRHRPLHYEALELNLPIGLSRQVLEGWSAFPSDHATLSFAIAVGIGLASRAAGAILLAQAALTISLPRVFLGLHFPSDVLGGALIGAGTMAMVSWRPAHQWFTQPLLEWKSSGPSFFYPVMIAVTIQLADMMGDLRALAGLVVRGLEALLRN